MIYKYCTKCGGLMPYNGKSLCSNCLPDRQKDYADVTGKLTGSTTLLSGKEFQGLCLQGQIINVLSAVVSQLKCIISRIFAHIGSQGLM